MTDTTETDDRLLGGRVILRQPGAGFRVSVDAVLLAAAVSIEPGGWALDVGCGAGGATLCLASRMADVTAHGIDRDAEMIACLGRNIADNGFDGRVSSETCDVADGVTEQLRGAFDHVFSNPPYLPPDRADGRRPSERMWQATVESVPIADWVSFMADCCRPKGRLTLVNRADRLYDLLAALSKRAGAIEILPIWPRADTPAKRVIVTARVGVGTPLRLCPGLVLHNNDGGYTDRARQLLEGSAALAFDGVAS